MGENHSIQIRCKRSITKRGLHGVQTMTRLQIQEEWGCMILFVTEVVSNASTRRLDLELCHKSRLDYYYYVRTKNKCYDIMNDNLFYDQIYH